MRKEDFVKKFKIGIDENIDYVIVYVELPGNEEKEKIINSNCDFDNKLRYYENTYNDDMIHNHCKDIKITGIEVFNQMVLSGANERKIIKLLEK